MATGLFVLGLAPFPFLLAGGWRVAGLAIGLCYGMQLVPAVVAACRSRELDGLAPSTWIMAWIEAVIWLVYGLLVLDPALLAGGASGTIMAADHLRPDSQSPDTVRSASSDPAGRWLDRCPHRILGDSYRSRELIRASSPLQ